MSRGLYHEDQAFSIRLAQPRMPYDRPPLHLAGSPYYCPVCGMGCNTKKEMRSCCKGMTPERPRTQGQLRQGGEPL